MEHIYTIYQQGIAQKKKDAAVAKEVIGALYELGDDTNIIGIIDSVCSEKCQKKKEVEFFLSTYLKYVGESGEQLANEDARVFEKFQSMYPESGKITTMLADVYAILGEQSEIYSEKLEQLSLTNPHLLNAVWVNAQNLMYKMKDAPHGKYESGIEKLKGYVEKYGVEVNEFDRVYASGLSNIVSRSDIDHSEKLHYLNRLRDFERVSSSLKVGKYLLEALYFYLKDSEPAEMNAILDEMRAVYRKYEADGIKCFFLCYGIAWQTQFLNKEQTEQSIREIESFANVWPVATNIAFKLRNNVYEF